MMELEEARGQHKDPRSFTRKMCYRSCLCGPDDHMVGPIVANIVNMLMIILNICSMLIFLEGNLIWLVSINIMLGMLT